MAGEEIYRSEEAGVMADVLRFDDQPDPRWCPAATEIADTAETGFVLKEYARSSMDTFSPRLYFVKKGASKQ